MFELLLSALFQLITISGQPASAIGNSGWGGGDATPPTQTNTIGNSGWGGGDSTPPATPAPGTGIGNSGWGGGD